MFGHWQQVLFLKLNDERTIYPDGSSDDALLLIPGISYASLPPNFLTGWVRDAAYYVELSGSPATLGSDASYLRFYAPGRARVADPRALVLSRLRGNSARAGSTTSPSCPPRSASSPAATAACAASRSTR